MAADLSDLDDSQGYDASRLRETAPVEVPAPTGVTRVDPVEDTVVPPRLEAEPAREPEPEAEPARSPEPESVSAPDPDLTATARVDATVRASTVEADGPAESTGSGRRDDVDRDDAIDDSIDLDYVGDDRPTLRERWQALSPRTRAVGLTTAAVLAAGGVGTAVGAALFGGDDATDRSNQPAQTLPGDASPTTLLEEPPTTLVPEAEVDADQSVTNTGPLRHSRTKGSERTGGTATRSSIRTHLPPTRRPRNKKPMPTCSASPSSGARLSRP